MPPTITDQKILEAALAVIAERGYAGATTKEIAAAAGINEVTLFRRFDSKRNLLAAAVEQEAENFSAAGIEYTGDLEADLLRIVRFYYGLMTQRGRVVLMLMSEVPRQPELVEIMQTPFGLMRKVSDLIARYQRDGVLVPEPPTQTFLALLGPLFLGGILGYLDPQTSLESIDPAQQVAHFLQGRCPPTASEAKK